VLHWYEGQLALAKRTFQEALDISFVVGSPWSQDQLLCNIGVVTLEQGFPTQAISLFERALRIAREIGDQSTEAITLSDLGRTYYYLGDLERAQEILEQALSMMAASGERWQMPYTHAYLARVFLATDEDDKALSHACTGLQVAQEIEDSRFLGLTHRVMAEVAAHLGSERAAAEPERHFEESIRILREIGAKAELARSLAAYGLYLVDSADASQAQRGAALVDEARRLFRQMGMARDLAQLEAKTATHLPLGQIRVRLPAVSAPTGRPLRDDEWVEVTWTVTAPEDDAVLGKVARRQQRLLRLLREAADQGAAPIVDDLGAALHVSRATIKRDLAALRKAGHQVRTRGSRNR
jgi:biotin operon repressor